MTRMLRILACAVIIGTAMLTASCDEGGIGVGLPASGARWGGGASGPGVIVGGGPVYH